MQRRVPIPQALAALADSTWDSDTELVTLTRADAVRALRNHLDGTLTDGKALGVSGFVHEFEVGTRFDDPRFVQHDDQVSHSTVENRCDTLMVSRIWSTPPFHEQRRVHWTAHHEGDMLPATKQVLSHG